MRLSEVYPKYSNIFKTNNDAAIKHGEQTVNAGKVMKKKAEISQTEQNLKDKRGQLQKITTPNLEK